MNTEFGRDKECNRETRWVPSVMGFGQMLMMNLLFLIASSPAMAVADPNIQLDMSVAKEVVVEQDGEEVRQWVEATDVQPGEKLRYTVNYVNAGDEPATEVKIENPIPDLTVYVSDSASGENSKIVFSADGGETYAPPEEVTYEVAVFGGGTDRRQAKPERYTNIRWLIDEIPPGANGEVSFVVTVQ